MYGRWNLLVKLDKLGFQPCKQGRETGAFWTDTSVNEKWNLLLKEIIHWDSNAASRISNTWSDTTVYYACSWTFNTLILELNEVHYILALIIFYSIILFEQQQFFQ